MTAVMTARTILSSGSAYPAENRAGETGYPVFSGSIASCSGVAERESG